MSRYETTATVEDQGQVRLAGVPFAAGTEVEITISPKMRSHSAQLEIDEAALSAARERMRELFRTVKGFRNSPLIPREDLYERGCLH